MAGTALAAVAAIGGLWAQAVASYWTQQTAKNQLSQSKEDSLRRAREQASKVTFWGGGGSAFSWGGTGTLPSSGTGGPALHVLNRSPDPVPAAEIVVAIQEKDPDSDEILREKWVLSLRDIPPCTHLEYPRTKLQLGAVQAAGDALVIGEAAIWHPVSMHFVDTRGKEWRRTQQSLKEGSMPSDIGDLLARRSNLVGVDAKVHQAESCGDEGKAE